MLLRVYVDELDQLDCMVLACDQTIARGRSANKSMSTPPSPATRVVGTGTPNATAFFTALWLKEMSPGEEGVTLRPTPSDSDAATLSEAACLGGATATEQPAPEVSAVAPAALQPLAAASPKPPTSSNKPETPFPSHHSNTPTSLIIGIHLPGCSHAVAS